jgi:imidazole glycerol-phosphate synthase subunit HisH
LNAPAVAIVDYGTGNVGSLIGAFARLGVRARATRDPKEIEGSGITVLPGVGSFPAVWSIFSQYQIKESVLARHLQKRPILGICLGFQLFAKESLEVQPTSGLSWIEQRVMPLPKGNFHLGWNNVTISENAPSCFSHFSGADFYFNHSFALENSADGVIGTTDCAGVAVPAFYCKEHLAGTQFHPEKSQDQGLELLRTLAQEYFGA